MIVYTGKIPVLRYLVPLMAHRIAMGKDYRFLLESSLQIVQMRRELGNRLEVRFYVPFVKGGLALLSRLVLDISGEFLSSINESHFHELLLKSV